MANVSRASSLDQKRLALATRGTTLDHTLYVFFFFFFMSDRVLQFHLELRRNEKRVAVKKTVI
jgi:hypothetical protein